MSIRSFICYLLMAGSLNAQELPPEIAEEWSNAIENGANENDVQRTLALLEFYLEYPLNINEADHDQLAEIAILSPSQIYAIIEHREKFGLFLTVEELQSISELDMTTLRKLRSFITAENPRTSLPLRKIIAEADHSIYLKWGRILEPKQGYRVPPEENGYAGTADKIYTRYLVNYPNKIYFNFIAEKDPGEKLFNPDIPERIDYLSFSLHISRLNPFVTDLFIGDYNVSMGQGLIAHNSFSTGKSTELAGLVKGGNVIKPYASVNENEMFRGLAASFQLGDRFNSTVFASRVRKDANVINTDSVTGEVMAVSSLLSGGYHRTSSEMADRDVLLENAAGMVLKYNTANFQLGMNQLLQSFDAFLELPQPMYNKFRPNGKTFTNTSVNFRYRFLNCHFFWRTGSVKFQKYSFEPGSYIFSRQEFTSCPYLSQLQQGLLLVLFQCHIRINEGKQ